MTADWRLYIDGILQKNISPIFYPGEMSRVAQRSSVTMSSLRQHRGYFALILPGFRLPCVRSPILSWRNIHSTCSPRSSGSPPSTADEATPTQSPPPIPAPLEFLDVPYFEREGSCDNKHRLDIYIPAAPFPRPRSRTCLFVHGGSWQRGDRRHPSVPDQYYGNVGRAFARAGMVGLVMSYRLAPGVQHPEQVRDVARAVRWAKDNVSQYGGDPRDLVLVGHSAGAHLAALCLSDPQWLEEQGLIPVATPPATYGADATGTATGVGNVMRTHEDQSRNKREKSPRSTDVTAKRGAEMKLTTATPIAPSKAVPPLSLREVSPFVVSGFVGISGVYDIPRMAGNVVGGMLARAAFGDDRASWRRASPLHCVRAAGAALVAAGKQLSAVEAGNLAIPGVEGGREKRKAASAGPETFVENTTLGNGLRVESVVDSAKQTSDIPIRESRSSIGAAENGKAGSFVADGSTNGTGEHDKPVLNMRPNGQAGVTDTDPKDGEVPPSAIPSALLGREAELITPAATTKSPSSSLWCCPLASVEVLLLTAYSDFHLEEDAHALAQALEYARREMSTVAESGAGSRGVRAGSSRAGRSGKNASNAMGEPDAQAVESGLREVRGDGDGDEDGRKGRGGDGGGGTGSVRHIRLKAEDHFSIMVSFGEEGKESSDTILNFIRGLPKPSLRAR